jgi:hypothetical protein
MAKLDDSCFIIMPFSKSSERHTEEYWTQHFNEFLKPIVEECGVNVYRVQAMREDIIKKIIYSLVTTPIVIADLTDHNPNVFWELGVRQSFKHNTITIAEEGTTLPFDVSSKATIFYDHSDEGKLSHFKNTLKAVINDCVTNPEKSDSHVLESISGRGSLYEIMRMDDSRRRIESLIVETKNNQNTINISLELVSKLKNFSYIPFSLRSTIWRTRSLEYLLVNRYLDEDERFYKAAELILRLLEYHQIWLPRLNLTNEDDNKQALNYLIGRMGKNSPRIIRVWLDTLEKIYHSLIQKMQTMVSETRFQSFKELKSVLSGTEYESWRE